MRLFACPRPTTPWRLSASVIIAAPRQAAAKPVEWAGKVDVDVGCDYRICMLKRSMTGSFGGTLVFPGGTTESVDATVAGDGATRDGILRVCAVREAFEEAGAPLFVGADDVGAGFPLPDPSWRGKVHSDAAQFVPFLERNTLRADTARLHEWVSFSTPDPQAAKMRNGGFETVFYVTTIPGEHTAGMGSDNAETTWMVWCSPAECLAAFEAGLVTLPPPQWCVMEELAAHAPRMDDLAAYAASPERRLIRDHHIKPYRIVPEEHEPQETKESGWRACYPGDELHPEYPGAPGGRHRIHIEKNRITRELNVPRDAVVAKAASA